MDSCSRLAVDISRNVLGESNNKASTNVFCDSPYLTFCTKSSSMDLLTLKWPEEGTKDPSRKTLRLKAGFGGTSGPSTKDYILCGNSAQVTGEIKKIEKIEASLPPAKEREQREREGPPDFDKSEEETSLNSSAKTAESGAQDIRKESLPHYPQDAKAAKKRKKTLL